MQEWWPFILIADQKRTSAIWSKPAFPSDINTDKLIAIAKFLIFQSIQYQSFFGCKFYTFCKRNTEEAPVCIHYRL